MKLALGLFAVIAAQKNEAYKDWSQYFFKISESLENEFINFFHKFKLNVINLLIQREKCLSNSNRIQPGPVPNGEVVCSRQFCELKCDPGYREG